jgi:hypothetical protein
MAVQKCLALQGDIVNKKWQMFIKAMADHDDGGLRLV